MATITPFLWFNQDLEEAMEFYISVFGDGKVESVSRGPDGRAFTATFLLRGQRFMGLNGAPAHATFTEAISLFVSCQSQDEVDMLWDRLTAGGGEESMCGWLKDRYGLSWQVIPERLGDLIGGPDPEKAGRAMQAMLQMQKIDIAALERAYAGG